MTTAVRLLCALILLAGCYVAAVEGYAAHLCGRARVHRGRSWQPRPAETRPARSVSPDRPTRAADGSLLIPRPDWRVGA